jgi:hypothetical protein
MMQLLLPVDPKLGDKSLIDARGVKNAAEIPELEYCLELQAVPLPVEIYVLIPLEKDAEGWLVSLEGELTALVTSMQ